MNTVYYRLIRGETFWRRQIEGIIYLASLLPFQVEPANHLTTATTGTLLGGEE